jgi:hypothetical protein
VFDPAFGHAAFSSVGLFDVLAANGGKNESERAKARTRDAYGQSRNRCQEKGPGRGGEEFLSKSAVWRG